MKLMEGWTEAVARKDRKVFSAKGQPQWRRKVSIVGFPSSWGRWSCEVDGTLAPIDGMGEGGSWEGKVQEAISCWKVMEDMVNIEIEGCYLFMI